MFLTTNVFYFLRTPNTLDLHIQESINSA